MRRPLVAGNWKMNGSKADSTALLDGILQGAGALKNVEMAVCPPYIYIPLAAEKLAGSPVVWGAQNVDTHASGAYTGEVSGPMLRDYGCTYAIVGHSERRNYFNEDDDLVAYRFGTAQEFGLIPILCVGETLEQREQGKTEAVVEHQIDVVLDAHDIARFNNAVIAYEPVWAIGTGKTATPEQAQEVHKFIRDKLAALDKAVADGLRILYGGSMKADNAKELIGQPDIDGGLIGGASLKADEFLAICRAAE